MRSHIDILDEPESLSKPFLGSVVLHVAVFASLFFLTRFVTSSRDIWGTPSPSGGGAVAINPVKSIPLPPRRGPQNPVANDSESVVPQAPKHEVKKKAPPPEPDA